MKEYCIRAASDPESIPIGYVPAQGNMNTLLIFVGGDGDGVHKFDAMVDILTEKHYQYNILTYSYRGLEIGIDRELGQKITDLGDVMSHAIEDLGITDFKIFCTSMGAFSVSHILVSEEFGERISTVLMIDPCNYYLSDKDTLSEKAFHWNGGDTFSPKMSVVSDVLKGMQSDARVHIIHLIVRVLNKKGTYVETNNKSRSIDIPGTFPRLNTDSTRAFYDALPEKNRGVYHEVNNLPHAFIRDGDISYNVAKMAELIQQYLN